MSHSLSRLPIIMGRHRWSALFTFTAVMGGLFAYITLAPRIYKVQARLLLEDKSRAPAVESTAIQQPGQDNLANQEQLITSKRFLESVLQDYYQQWSDSPGRPLSVGVIRKNLTANIVPSTDVLKLKYSSSDPQMAARLLNIIAQTIVKENAETSRAEVKSTREFLDKQLPMKRQQLQKIEERMSQFKQKHGYVTLDSKGGNNETNQLLVQNYANLENQARTLVAQIKEINDQNQSLRTLTQASGITQTFQSVRSGQDPELQKLRSQLADLESQVSSQRSELTDNHPRVIQLLAKRNAARTLYERRLAQLLGSSITRVAPNTVIADQVGQDLSVQLIQGEIKRRSLQERLDAVRNNLKLLETRRKQFPVLEQGFTQMDRQRQTLLSSIQLLERKSDEVQVSEAKLLSNFKIIDLANPNRATSSPNIPIVMGLGTLAGAVLSMGVILLLEASNRKLYSADEIEELVQLPVLSTLPKLSKVALNLDEPDFFYENSGFLEAYRALLKALEFRALEEFQILVISSAISGEGKSVVTAYLAAVAALLSRRTLVIDADLRRPTLHKQFRLPNTTGLSDVLAGDVNLEEAAQATKIDNLSVVTAGKPCVFPSKFFESEDIQQLLGEASATYDFIIVDTPPVTSCVDAMTLSRERYPLLFIARPNVTEKNLLKRAVSELQDNNVKVLGVAVNDGVIRTDRYYQYRLQSYQES